MKQSLSLKLGQQLTMTPQLQQAIRLLQLSTLDLRLEIQQAVETNPMLELVEDDDDDAAAEASSGDDEIPAAIGPMTFRELAGDGDSARGTDAGRVAGRQLVGRRLPADRRRPKPVQTTTSTEPNATAPKSRCRITSCGN